MYLTPLNPLNPSDNDTQPTWLPMWKVLWYALKGMPIYIKHLKTPWRSLRVPRFPIGFCILGGLLYVLPLFAFPSEQEVQMSSISDRVMFSIAGAIACFMVLVVLDTLFLLWCILLLKIYGRLSSIPTQTVVGSQRVVYFSAVYQPVVPLFFGLAWASLPGHLNIPYAIEWLVVNILLLAVIVRIMVIFQGMRRESDGSICVGLLSLLPCLDIWVAILFVFFELIP